MGCGRQSGANERRQGRSKAAKNPQRQVRKLQNNYKFMDRNVDRIYEFDGFQLIPSERLLLRNGEAVPLTHKVFDILLLLVRNSGQLIAKEKLLQAIWSEQFVEEHNLTVSISSLRKALGETHDKHDYIETVPKHGYRFIANVRESADQIADGRVISDMSSERRIDPFYTLNGVPSLAVLPFFNVGADGNAEYLCSGITESIIASLSRLPQLRVMAYSTVVQYKDLNLTPQKVGRLLGVNAVVVGRISHVEHNLRIATELVDVETGWQLWGAHYEPKPSDLLAIQNEISREVSENLRLHLTREQELLLAKTQTDNTEAFHLYLKGRYNWNKRTPSATQRAIEYFDQAIAFDPNYALAYAGLADCYNVMPGNSGLPPKATFPKAKAAASRALEIDDTLAEAHTSLSLVQYLFDWKWSAAEKGFVRAIELNPNYATAHHWYGEYLGLMRRFDVGFKELMKAQSLDPLSLPITADLGQYYFFRRMYEHAVEQLTKALELEPNFVRALALLAWTFEQMGRHDEAIAKFEEATVMSGSRTLIVAGLAHAHAISGNRKAALEILTALNDQRNVMYVSPYEIAVIHVALGETQLAFDFLDKAYDDRSVWLSWLLVDPRLDALRRDARFATLVRQMGLQP